MNGIGQKLWGIGQKLWPSEETVQKSELQFYTKSEIDDKISDLDLKIRNTRYIKSIFFYI